ncbi:hypothetical protein AAFC00_005949 [Neodothiora populina]|uniref:Zinc transporter n=1 Tax=Neodothiora populina TaxID=2781224 RepID=A0ABR3P6R4_9PEZI
MADQLPLPIPPRTPTPISDDEHDLPTASGLGIEGAYASPIGTRYAFDPASSSPPSEVTRSGSARADMLSPTFSLAQSSPNDAYSPLTPQSVSSEPAFQKVETRDSVANPFNFTPQQYTVGRPPSAHRPEAGKRRGHTYQRSSIHINAAMIPEPARRLPLQSPAALPTPTRKEVHKSMTSDQKARLVWCFCHFLVAGYVQWSAHASLAMTALSRLLLFDAAGAVTCVLVEVMGNFEVWTGSTIKHPFGLERVDVLAGFGLAVFIGFMGIDILSHGIQHLLENAGNHVAHSAHVHPRLSAGSVDVAALLAIVSTLISAVLLKNHSRIGKAMRFNLIAGWGAILGNPSHFLTLSCSTMLLMLPLLSLHTYKWFDSAMSFGVAFLMIAFGARLGTSLAAPLLMSYKGPGGSARVKDVIAEIARDPLITAVEDARFWQVHYGLCMANLSLKYRGSEYGDELVRIRDKVTSLVRNRLGGGYGNGALKWEVTVQLASECD